MQSQKLNKLERHDKNKKRLSKANGRKKKKKGKTDVTSYCYLKRTSLKIQKDKTLFMPVHLKVRQNVPIPLYNLPS